MDFFISSVCDLLISIAETSLSSASRLGCYQPNVRALKQLLHDRKETKQGGKRKRKKILTAVLSLALLTLQFIMPVCAEEKGSAVFVNQNVISQINTEDYNLEDSSIRKTETGIAIDRIYKDQNVVYDPLTGEYTEAYVYSVKYIDDEELKSTSKSMLLRALTETGHPQFFHDSIVTNVIYKYTQSYGTDNIKYYRLNSLTYSIAAVYDGFVVTDSYLEIANNGIGNTTTVMGKRSKSHLGTATSGTIYGNSSWTPTISLDDSTWTTATRFYIQIDARRGSNSNYSDYWIRPFH